MKRICSSILILLITLTLPDSPDRIGVGVGEGAYPGPNLWIALLALHYDRMVKGMQYQALAEDIVRWAISLPHFMGGVAMSNRDEWRASWSKVVSTEEMDKKLLRFGPKEDTQGRARRGACRFCSQYCMAYICRQV